MGAAAYARHEKYTEHADVVIQEAKRMYRRLAGRIEFDELVGIGTEALLRAIDRLDTSRAAHERRAYVRLRVRGALCDELGNIFNLPRRAWRRQRLGTLSVGNPARNPNAIDDDHFPTLSPEVLREQMAEAIDAARARRALNLLPDRSCELLFRVYFEGRTLVDAAEMMGVSASWASRLRRDALASLRSQLLLSMAETA